MTRPMVRLLAAILIGLSVFTGCGSLHSGGEVSVLATWTGAEEKAFRQVLDAFTDKTGIHVTYRGTRAPNDALLSNLQRGTPPDVAILPSIGLLTQYARSGDLRPLDGVLTAQEKKEYAPEWLRPTGGKTYMVPMKVNFKSMIWYDPARLSNATPGISNWPPATWNDLVADSRALADRGTTPWCMGMGDTPSSGWPGTDWVEDILLHQSGVAAYQEFAAGTLPWTSNEVDRAWTTWGQIVTGRNLVRGGTKAAMLTDFGDAGQAMFGDPPGCLIEHQPSFIVGNYRQDKKAGGGIPQAEKDYDFFPFPRFSGSGAQRQPVEVSADLAGMFNDTSGARKLIRYLASSEAQRIWPAIDYGSAFSVNDQVPPSVHGGDRIATRIAEIMRGAGAVCPDAADLMPQAMSDAFNGAALQYLADPGRLHDLLTELDQQRTLTQRTTPDEWLKVSCVPRTP
ncbi:ABC transporter substrate-binding protein [Actinoallomurus acanthiterrae]